LPALSAWLGTVACQPGNCELGVVPAPILDEDWPLASGPQTVWTARQTIRAFLDDESLPVLGLDDEFLAPASRQAVAWLAATFLDAHELISICLDDGEPPPLYATLATWAARPFLDDEIHQTELWLEDEMAPIVPVQSIPWLALPFIDTSSSETPLVPVVVFNITDSYAPVQYVTGG
jgi:hypothetical protein